MCAISSTRCSTGQNSYFWGKIMGGRSSGLARFEVWGEAVGGGAAAELEATAGGVEEASGVTEAVVSRRLFGDRAL